MITTTDKRVFLREHMLADKEAFMDWQLDPEFSCFLSWLPKTPEEAYRNLIDAIAQQWSSRRQRYYMAIVLKETRIMVGDVGFTRDSCESGNMGWFIRRNYWGLGFATEAAQLMIRYGFEKTRLRAFHASCRTGNKASERVMKKCGFRLERSEDGRLYYQLLREDWADGLRDAQNT